MVMPGSGVDYHLNGRVVLITGVSRRRGIGAAIACKLANEGADVMIQSWAHYDAEQPWGEDNEGIDMLLAKLRANGTRAEHVSADFAAPDSARLVMEACVSAFGHVDAVVANHARCVAGRLEDLTADELDTSFAVNARSTALLVKEFASQHDGRDGGRVVLFTSGQHLGPMPDELSYAISKGAVQQMTASLARNLSPRRITVNCINPGPTDTGWPEADTYQAVLARQPQGRWGEPDDAARLVAWLLSNDAQWVTGQTLVSEGGFER